MPFVLLHISTLLTFILLIFTARIKNKKEIHYLAVGLVLVIFLWCAVSLVEQYLIRNFDYHGMLITNISFTITSFLPVTLFCFGLVYAHSGSAPKMKYYYLFIIPVVSIIFLWTNDLHHLYFVNYSNINSSFVKGYFFIAQTIVGFFLDFFGLFYLIMFSTKNSGFFSRPTLLIVIGALCPFVVDLAFVFNIFTFPIYYETISFSIAIIFFMTAILRFGFLSIIPIALQTVVDHISDSYIVINEEFKIIDFNRSFTENFKDIIHITRRDGLREFCNQLEYMSFISYDGFIELINDAISAKKSVSLENQLLSGQIDRTYTIEITPIFSQSIYKGTVILLKDITEQKKSFEMIRQTQVMLIESEHLASLGQLVGGIAHNLKTPIMSISGGLEGLSDLITEYDESIGDDSITQEDHHEIAEDMRVWIGKMRDYCAYMSDIITTVKGQAVQLTASTTDKFLLRELIKRVDILMNHELKKYGCRLNLICSDEEHIEVKGEVNSLVQVINNLIINSIEAYEGSEGEIDFIITREDDMTQFVVKDYASGMTDEVKNKLFREMITTKAKFGTGLGLYMSYSTICGRFGGKMWFESELGKGTAFYVQVPAV
jgi:two-component system sensor histidine kinase HupT/HoxJ